MKPLLDKITPYEFGLICITISLFLLFLGYSSSFAWTFFVLLCTFVPSFFGISSLYLQNQELLKNNKLPAKEEKTKAIEKEDQSESIPNQQIGKLNEQVTSLTSEIKVIIQEKEKLIREKEEIKKEKEEIQKEKEKQKEEEIRQLKELNFALQQSNQELERRLSQVKEEHQVKQTSLLSETETAFNREIANLKEQVKSINQEKEQLTKENEQLAKEKEKITNEIDNHKSDNLKLSEEIETLKNKIKKLENNTALAQENPSDLQQALDILSTTSLTESGDQLRNILSDIPDDFGILEQMRNKKVQPSETKQATIQQKQETIQQKQKPIEQTQEFFEQKKEPIEQKIAEDGNTNGNATSESLQLDIPDDAQEWIDQLPKRKPKKGNTLPPSLASLFNPAPQSTRQKFLWKNGMPIMSGFSSKEDTNIKGMRRAKKKNLDGSPANKMEDKHVKLYPFYNDSKKAFFGVFDGHAGDKCSTELTKIFPQEANKLTLTNKDMKSELKELFSRVDSNLTKFEDEGSTATIVLIWQHENHRYLQAANVGDSTAFLKRGNQVICLSEDHKPTSENESKRVRELGVVDLPKGASRLSGLAVSRAMGDFFFKQMNTGLISEPYVSPLFELQQEDDILIIASDGLWDVISGEEAMKQIESLPDAEAMASSLIKNALQEPKCNDNITVLVVTF